MSTIDTSILRKLIQADDLMGITFHGDHPYNEDPLHFSLECWKVELTADEIARCRKIANDDDPRLEQTDNQPPTETWAFKDEWLRANEPSPDDGETVSKIKRRLRAAFEDQQTT